MNFQASGLEEVRPLLKGEAVYSLGFSLDGCGRPVRGVCAATRTELCVFRDGAEVFRCPLDEVEEYTTTQLVGSGTFGIVRNGKPEQLCICTQSELNAFAELGKLLEYHKETGVFPEPDGEEEVKTCPKCGSILPEGSSLCFRCAPKGKYLARAKIGRAHV